MKSMKNSMRHLLKKISLNRRAALLALLLAASCVGLAQQQRRGGALSWVNNSPIREDALRAHIKYLADDMMEGRGPGTRGGELAAKYIAAQFEALGLKGAGPGGSFFQPVSLVGVKADPRTTFNISGASAAEDFKFA